MTGICASVWDAGSRTAAHHALLLRTDAEAFLTFRSGGNRVEVTPYRKKESTALYAQLLAA